MKIKCVISACLLVAGAFAAGQKGSFGSAFQDLARDDQVEFIRAVNKSMETYQASSAQKRLNTIYAVNRDAVRGASEQERKAVIAEVFATAPMDSLPTIADRFASELFSRKAGGFGDNDDSFVEFASAALMRVRNRLRAGVPVENFPGARSAFAVICFLKASEGKPAGLQQDFLFYILSGSQEKARKEWIPAALGADGHPPSYQPILEAGITGEVPAHGNAHPVSMQGLQNFLVGSELRIHSAKDVSSPNAVIGNGGIGGANSASGMEQGLARTPRTEVHDPDSPWYRRRRGNKPEDEAGPYGGQGL